MLKQIIQLIMGYRGFFSLEQLVTDSGWERAEVKHRLDRLEAEGLIKRCKERPGQNHKRPGGPAPKEILYIKGKGLPARLAKMTATQKKETDCDKLWRTIRVMRRFTTTDLIQLASVTEDNVRAYLKVLRRDGWVRKVGKASSGLITWVLIKDAGPARPRIAWKNEGSRIEDKG